MTAEVLPEEAVSQEIRFLWSSLIMLTPLPLQNFFEEPPIAQSNVNFTDMNLSRSLLKVSICDRPILIIVWLPRFCHNIQAVHAIGFDSPTPIQVAAVPMALLGKDICACAATGTGLYYYSTHTHTHKCDYILGIAVLEIASRNSYLAGQRGIAWLKRPDVVRMCIIIRIHVLLEDPGSADGLRKP